MSETHIVSVRDLARPNSALKLVGLGPPFGAALAREELVVEELNAGQIRLFHPIRARASIVDDQIKRAGRFMLGVGCGRRVNPPPQRDGPPSHRTESITGTDRRLNDQSVTNRHSEICMVLHAGIVPAGSSHRVGFLQ